jgi:hypothetical protein
MTDADKTTSETESTEQPTVVSDNPKTPWDVVKDIDFGDRPTTGATDEEPETPEQPAE